MKSVQPKISQVQPQSKISRNFDLAPALSLTRAVDSARDSLCLSLGQGILCLYRVCTCHLRACVLPGARPRRGQTLSISLNCRHPLMGVKAGDARCAIARCADSGQRGEMWRMQRQTARGRSAGWRCALLLLLQQCCSPTSRRRAHEQRSGWHSRGTRRQRKKSENSSELRTSSTFMSASRAHLTNRADVRFWV